jgi:hypothetical protein
MLLISVFFTAFSTLIFEVLLTRIFSISQWNHLSFMVISIALFGFGASGTFLSIVEIRKRNWLMNLASRNSLAILLDLYAFATILSFLALNQLPLDYFRIPVEPGQILYLLAAYLLPALPFFFSGMIISLAYITVPQKTGLVYFASMAGSALGAFAPVFLLPLLGEARFILIAAVAALLPVALPNRASRPDISKNQRGSRSLGVGCALAIVLFAAVLLSSANENLIQVNPSPYKALSQILQFPNTHIAATAADIRGRVDQVKSPYIRFAPGLSLKYMDELPRQYAAFRDGDSQYVFYDFNHNLNAVHFAQYLLSYLGYYLRPNPEKVLLIGNGGGSAIACAAASGARQIFIVEPSPRIAAILRRQYPYQLINRNPRAFLARSRNIYDIIHIENWGTSIPGAAALNQEHFFTIEAFTEYWNHLLPQGFVIISRKLLLPPSDSLRLWSEAYEALVRAGIEHPPDHLAMLRNFDTFTLIVSKSIIDFKRVIEFADHRNFDPVFLQGMPSGMANRFNVFDQPYHFEQISRLASMYRAGRPQDFFNGYLLDVAPQSDRRPFPSKFLKWTRLKTLYHTLGQRFYTLFMSGEIVIAVVFAEALLVAVLLLVIPLRLATRRSRKPIFSQAIYFFAVGAGFMFVELYFIKRFIILLVDPVISFTLVLAGILLFTSLAGLWVHKSSRPRLRWSLFGLIIVLVLESVLFELLCDSILKLPIVMQYAVALLFLLPVGFLMGLPFPLGMRDILDSPVQRAYAWSVNGCASVLSSIAAAQVAISWGIPQIAFLAVGAYLSAYFCTGKKV